ncbi:MAG: MopE-related protein, partial [Myxococcota bacterium]
ERAWYADADGDGHGDPGASLSACDAPDGYVDAATDCDDTDATAHPGGEDVAGDGVDQDCDGADAAPVDTGDTAEPSDSGAAPDKDADEGCACASGTGDAAWILAFGAAIAVRRRRGR